MPGHPAKQLRVRGTRERRRRGRILGEGLVVSNPVDGFDAALAALLSAPDGALRPYQAKAIERCREAIARGVRRLILQLATGGGKTLVASAISAGFRAMGGRVLFVGARTRGPNT